MQTYEKEDGDTDGPYYLGVAVTKTITSDSNDSEDSSDTSETTSKLVYYSSIYMLSDQINEAVSGANFDLFLNTLSWLTEKESSISIRAKSLDSESLVVDAGAAYNWEILMIGLVPIAILICGGVVCYRRRKQ
jgi:ABC-2 type transport system permease protein